MTSLTTYTTSTNHWHNPGKTQKRRCHNDHHNHNVRVYMTKEIFHYTKPTLATTDSTKSAPYAKALLNGATRYADPPADIYFIPSATASTVVLDDEPERMRRSRAPAAMAVET